MSKISIIIPVVYNTIDYLERCLLSVQNQTYQNLEIICVDDGSSDGSEKLVDEFVEKDSRFVVIHQDNGGESNARNTGLLAATGDYIGFMDCDDWIEPESYELLLNKMKECDADIGLGSFTEDTDEEVKLMENEHKVEEGVFNRSALFKYIYKRDYYRGVSAYIWCKLYKREIVFEDGKPILFDETLRLGGDNLWLLYVMKGVKQAVWVPIHFYHYYQRKTSTFHTKDMSIMMQMLTTYQKMIDYMESNCLEEESIGWVKRFHGYWAYKLSEMAMAQQDKTRLLECQRVMEQRQPEYEMYNLDYPERIEDYKMRMTWEIG